MIHPWHCIFFIVMLIIAVLSTPIITEMSSISSALQPQNKTLTWYTQYTLDLKPWLDALSTPLTWRAKAYKQSIRKRRFWERGEGNARRYWQSILGLIRKIKITVLFFSFWTFGKFCGMGREQWRLAIRSWISLVILAWLISNMRRVQKGFENEDKWV